MGDETRPEGYIECREKCGRWKHQSQATCWECWFALRPEDREDLAERAKASPDWTPISPPAEPAATWRGMRVGQEAIAVDKMTAMQIVLKITDVGTSHVVASHGVATAIYHHGLRPHREFVESWTLVSDPERIQEPPPVPPRPAKAGPAKAVCSRQQVGKCSGAVLLRTIGAGPVLGLQCDACYLERERLAALGTRFTESPPPKAPRYPASNDVDQDIPDA